ncbi:unnamed protein product [Lampetra planeri]
MRNACLLLLLLGALCQGHAAPADGAQDDVQAQEDFDASRFLGTWYVTALASNCNHVAKYTKLSRSFKMELEASEEENKFTVTSTKSKNGACYQHVSTYELIENGKFFTITKWRHAKHMTLTVIRTDYETHAILYYGKVKEGKIIRTMRMLARSPDVSEDLMNEFRSLSLEMGLAEENVFQLPYTDECIAGEEGLILVPRTL